MTYQVLRGMYRKKNDKKVIILFVSAFLYLHHQENQLHNRNTGRTNESTRTSSSSNPSAAGLFESEGWEGDADVHDWEPFRLLGRSMIDYIADYYRDIEYRPVRAQVEPGYLQVGG